MSGQNVGLCATLKALFLTENIFDALELLVPRLGKCACRSGSTPILTGLAARPRAGQRGGYVLTLFGNALSVASKRFPTVALSTMEAEYMTLSESLRSLMHFRNMAKEFDCFEVPDKLDVFCDNQLAIFISENLVNNDRSKHIDIRFHFIREKIQEGLVNLSHIATDLNMADIFTKPLTTEVFTRLRRMFMGY